MAAEVQPLAPLNFPAGPSPVTAEQRYWKSFKNQKSHTSTANWPVTHISFPSSTTSSSSLLASSLATAARTNDFFAVTNGPRVDLYSIRRRDRLKTIGRFDSVARCGTLRQDARLLVTGDDSGKVQVFDVSGGTRATILRTWHVHKQPVWTTKWSPIDSTALMSTSDDRTVALWDLPSGEPSRRFHSHEDYVRCGEFVPSGVAGGNLLASGSYDKTVRLWDTRTPGNAVLTFKHAAPIEAVLPLPRGTSLLAASDHNIAVLDLVAARPLHLLSNHQKTVTALSLASNGRRVVSGGLDGHIKVFDTSNWNVVAGAKYPSPILSLAVIPAGPHAQDRHLAVGMQSGLLSIRTCLTGAAAERERERAALRAAEDAGRAGLDRLAQAKAKRKRVDLSRRAMDVLGDTVDFVIPTAPAASESSTRRRRRRRELAWQRDLRNARYAQALDAVLDPRAASYAPLTGLAALMALRHRSALRTSLVGRDEHTVQPVLQWVMRYIVDPRYVAVCVDVGMHLLDLYSEYAGRSSELAAGFSELRRRVKREIYRARGAIMTGGMLDNVMAMMELEAEDGEGEGLGQGGLLLAPTAALGGVAASPTLKEATAGEASRRSGEDASMLETWK